MFGTKYSRLKFWVISIPLFIVTMFFASLGQNLPQLLGPFIIDMDGMFRLNIIVLAGITIWLNTLANRIRDYGSNPWISLFSFLPLVNIGLTLYYGIVKYKKVSLDNTMSNHSKSQSIEENESIISMDCGNDDEIYEQVSSREKDNKVKVTKAESTVANTTNEQDIEIDDEVYEQALLEIEENRKVKGTWAKALAKSDGDLSKTEALYIKYRTHAIIEEEKKITQYKTDLENGRLLRSMKNILLKDGYYQYSNKTVYVLGLKGKITYEVMLDTEKMLLSILGNNGKPVVSYPLK